MATKPIDLVSARVAVNADLSTTAALAAQVREEIADDRGGRWLLEHDLPRVAPATHHEHALQADDRLLIVGTIDDLVVGHALAYITSAIADDLCMIEELVVHPRARAIGVGSAILAEVHAWAVAQGCAAIESHVLPGNRAAKNFFERVGMKTRKMRVSAEL